LSVESAYSPNSSKIVAMCFSTALRLTWSLRAIAALECP
jgi:hypothetical protein